MASIPANPTTTIKLIASIRPMMACAHASFRPSMRGRCGRCVVASGRLSRTNTTTASAEASAKAAATRSGNWKPSAPRLGWASRPPIAGPVVKPALNAAPMIPIRAARFSGGVMSAIAPCRVEMLPAKTPVAKRIAKAAMMLGAKASAA